MLMDELYERKSARSTGKAAQAVGSGARGAEGAAWRDRVSDESRIAAA